MKEFSHLSRCVRRDSCADISFGSHWDEEKAIISRIAVGRALQMK